MLKNAIIWLASKRAFRYNAASMEDVKYRVVGSVSDWKTWCEAAKPEVVNECDWVELRVDALPEDISPECLLAQRPACPVLLTVRHESEGGCRSMTEEQRLSLAMKLLPLATAVDWETAQLEHAQELVQAAKAAGVTVIASNHDFEKTPSLATLKEREARARSLGADVVKFAWRLHSAEDIMVGVQLLREATGPLAVMGMGPLGAVSRLLYVQHGSCLIYGYLGNTPTAPGQWSAALCKRALASTAV